MSKDAYILRGLSGSGKSTLAKRLCPKHPHICSTDSFFYDDSGIYRFKIQDLPKNHGKNQAVFEDLCKKSVECIVCDNTNMRHWEMEPYIKAAKEFGYNVHVVLVGVPRDESHQIECSKRNKHGVSLEVIKKMAAKFEL